MRYRRLDPNGDYTFGQGQGNFWINQPEAVAQSVMTRLLLEYGQWFADTSDGTPWSTQVLGERTASTRDVVIRSRVQTTQGFQDFQSYYSTFDPNTRAWSAAMTLDTVYGAATLQFAAPLPGAAPPLRVLPGGAGSAFLLGISGATVAGMQPANLLSGPLSDITNFKIGAVDAGKF